MPNTNLIFYTEDNGSCPLLDWFDNLPEKAQDKCLVKIERLTEMGHELRRPEADYLRDKIYELRAALNRVQYRILYFFHESDCCILSHGLIKEKKVPPKEIDLAIRRRENFLKDLLLPTLH